MTHDRHASLNSARSLGKLNPSMREPFRHFTDQTTLAVP
jgi:hypothetical protein